MPEEKIKSIIWIPYISV